jgi:hypothetical protein
VIFRPSGEECLDSVNRKCDMIAHQRQPVARFEPDVTEMKPAAKGAPAQEEKRQEWQRTYDAAHR